MDVTHWIVIGTVLIAVALTVVVSVIGFRKMHRKLETDEAIDAAQFLALRELRDWLERNRPVGSQSKPS